MKLSSPSLINIKEPIGVIGLGLMGQGFVHRLDLAQVPVLGFDVNPKRCSELGLERSKTLCEIAEQCHAVILCVFNTEQVEMALFGDNGLLPAVPSGKTLSVICTSTCDPEQIKAIAQKTISLGHNFLELPISGTSMQVARGDSLGLMGGSEELIHQLEPLLEVITPNRQYIGQSGDAGKAKLSINLVLGLHRAAMAEGLCFGSRLGLDPEKLLATLQKSAAASSVMQIKGPLMVKRSYNNPQSRVDQSLKDFGLIHELSEKMQQHLPLTEIYIQLLESQKKIGKEHLDNAIIFEAIMSNAIHP